MGGQAQNKVGLDIETEGNSPLNQNSFAVLANPHIINLAQKMGIHSESITFEKIDVLKDLETTRMKLNEYSNVVEKQSKTLEEVTFPLEDQNVLEWGSDESEEEPYIIPSVRKSRSFKKFRKKSRAIRNYPLEVSDNLDGDKSKASPRFNLRDRNTIKKLIK